MINLIAIAAESGWAFVRHTNRLYLVRPPYVAGNRFEVSESTVERAVSEYGFQTASQDFADWGELVHILRDGIVKARERAGERVPTEGEAGVNLLTHAPPEILARYLERVERELIPNGELRAARTLLNAMLSLERVRTNPTMLTRATQLRERCYARLEQQMEAEKKREELANNPDALADQFPMAVAKYGKALAEFIANIQRRGRLLEMGA